MSIETNELRSYMAGSGNIAARSNSADARLRDACAEFEGMLIGIILKQGMKPSAAGEEPGAGNDIMTDFSVEQAARQMGHTGAFGIGRMIYEQVSGCGGHADE